MFDLAIIQDDRASGAPADGPRAANEYVGANEMNKNGPQNTLNHGVTSGNQSDNHEDGLLDVDHLTALLQQFANSPVLGRDASTLLVDDDYLGSYREIV